MAVTAPRFDRMVPAAPESIGALRRELRRWARRQGAPAGVQGNVALAFSEACSTILGPEPLPEPLPRPLVVQARAGATKLVVRVSNSGSAPAVGVGHGFGLALMAGVCDRFEVRRREDRPGVAVLMTFRLAPERSSPRPPSRSTTRR